MYIYIHILQYYFTVFTILLFIFIYRLCIHCKYVIHISQYYCEIYPVVYAIKLSCTVYYIYCLHCGSGLLYCITVTYNQLLQTYSMWLIMSLWSWHEVLEDSGFSFMTSCGQMEWIDIAEWLMMHEHSEHDLTGWGGSHVTRLFLV